MTDRFSIYVEHNEATLMVVVGEQLPLNLAAAVREGTLLDSEFEPIPRPRAERLRRRLLSMAPPPGPPGGLRWLADGEEEGKWLLPGIWSWGTIPILGGNPKAGKTTLAIDLTAALLLPEHRFLGRFGATRGLDKRQFGDYEIDESWTGNSVWYINAETPPGELERQMRAIGLDVVDDALTVDHLELEGGPHLADFTEADRYDVWTERLFRCVACGGHDDWSPTVVIVDGLTAILQAAGKGVESYGLWFAAFRRLMHELGVPNALVIAHNTLQGGHLMGGVEAQAGADGLWNYSSRDGDRAGSQRRFSVVPRIGGAAIEPTPVDMIDGRLLLRERRIEREGPHDRSSSVLGLLASDPGGTRHEIQRALEISEWETRTVIDDALLRGVLREELCSESCKRCAKGNGKRRHLYLI